MQVVNIRGTTSSGKTYTMRKIIAMEPVPKIISLTKEVKGTLLPIHKLIVIGTYKKGGKFGGCDSIAKVEYMEEAIWKALTIRPTVLFEGLLVSHSYGRWKDFSDKLRVLQTMHKAKENGMTWGFITPPFRVNLEQLKRRNGIKNLRKERGEKFVMNFIQRYKSIVRLKKKAIEDNETIINLFDCAYSWDYIIQYLSKYGDQILLKGNKKKGINRFIK